ncbi:MAG: hypothetical protein IKW28_04390 [Lachnospiraceae bacterium]|nr:hypothetical protein [Lachnospiraceae bacterium]
MERLIKANFYKLIKRRETYFLLLLICVESAVSASIPKTGDTMFIDRCNIPLALDVELAFLAVIIFAENYAKGTWYGEFLNGYARRNIIISKLVVYGIISLIVSILAVGIPFIISSWINGGGYPSNWHAILSVFFSKNLFIISVMTLTAILLRKRIITLAVGTGICFFITKISEYLLEPIIPNIVISFTYILLSFIFIMLSIGNFSFQEVQ